MRDTAAFISGGIASTDRNDQTFAIVLSAMSAVFAVYGMNMAVKRNVVDARGVTTKATAC